MANDYKTQNLEHKSPLVTKNNTVGGQNNTYREIYGPVPIGSSALGVIDPNDHILG